MTVYIVMRNGNVDAVFDNENAAIDHCANLLKKWNIAVIYAREVQSL